jgi:hypothetical protein
MLFAVSFLALVATVPLTGGDIKRLADHRLKTTWFLIVALGIQTALATGNFGDQGVAVISLHIVSYTFCLGFLVANPTLPGLWVGALGGGVNLVAIAVNHGVMPATHSAMAAAGKLDQSSQLVNSTVLADPKFLFLGDVFAVPQPLFFANVFSAGDVLMVIGAGILLHQICRRAMRSTDGSVGAAQPASSATADSNTSEWTSTSAAVV